MSLLDVPMAPVREAYYAIRRMRRLLRWWSAIGSGAYLVKPYKKIRCPFHEEKTPSCLVSAASETFHCLGCGRKGYTPELYAAVERRRMANGRA